MSDTVGQTELEYTCAECAAYIMMRLEHVELTEHDLAMWIHDHLSTEEET